MASISRSSDISNNNVDWADLLTTTRHLLNSDSNDESLALARSHFLPLRDLLQEYNIMLLDSESVSKEDKKRITLDTRSALRVALSCSSIEDEEIRDQILTEAVGKLAWHKPLVQILVSKKGDAKCRVFASQLLSNLVTLHSQSAKEITSYVALSPSRDDVTDRIRQDLATNEDGTNLIMEPNWVDMMLVCAHANSRQSLAGVVAALHNSIVSLQKCSCNQNIPCSTTAAVATDRLLVSTLLRQVVPVQAVKEMIEGSNKKEVTDSNNNDNLGDAATEWISLLLRKCCSMGLLPTLYSSISGENDSVPTVSNIAIYPEHIVLLQCINSELDAPGSSRNEILLGGDAGDQGVITTHLFLAELYCSILKSLESENNASTQSSNVSPEWTMKTSALLVVLEILASSIGGDAHFISLARSKLGEGRCTLIQTAGRHLGALLDSISYRNEGRKSRDFVMLEEEQCIITALVRLVGNVCFQCHQNQELLRFTLVPPLKQSGRPSSESLGEERNALHVLLSCTSLAHSCFTLREWGVVAIRNVLDNNENNQAVVAKLEANAPVQSAELANLGIKVDMDSKGKVSVSPTEAMAKIDEE